MVFVLNIGIVLSFFLGILLFSKKDKALTDNILSIWLFIIGIHLTGYYLYFQGYWETYPHLIGITAPLPFLYGPFLYLYVLYSIKSKGHLQKIDYLHFTPTLISYLYMVPFYFFYSIEEKVEVDKGLVNDFSVFTYIMLIGCIISGIGYSILSYQKLLQREKVIEENFSNSDYINLSWLRHAILGIVSVFITAALVSIFREVLDFQFPFNADILFYSIIVGFVVYIGYSGIRQQDLFTNTSINEEELVKAESEYKKSSLNFDFAEEKHNELLDLMNKKKPYLNPKLTLSELAQSLNIPTNHLSQIINNNLNQHFFDFVNGYRIRKAMDILKNPEKRKLTILEILYEVGFNSKSSFNTEFKKYTNQTPTQFRENILNSKD